MRPVRRNADETTDEAAEAGSGGDGSQMIGPGNDHAERALVERARRGDTEAAAALVQRYRDALVGYCYRQLGRYHEAEDVAQDVLAKVTAERRWPSGSFRAWLYRLARNRCTDVGRRHRDPRAHLESSLRDSRLASPVTGPRTALVRSEQKEELHRHIPRLSRPHAEVLMLRYFDELTRAEIAEVLELPESVVKSRLYEARRELQRRMNESRER